jgi:hypothetical protein
MTRAGGNRMPTAGRPQSTRCHPAAHFGSATSALAGMLSSTGETRAFKRAKLVGDRFRLWSAFSAATASATRDSCPATPARRSYISQSRRRVGQSTVWLCDVKECEDGLGVA